MSKVTLLPFDPKSHKHFVAKLLGNPKLMYGWGMGPLTSETDLNKWLGDPKRVNLIIADVNSHELLGYVDFYDWDKNAKEADWGVVIDPAFSGKGYAQMAAKASIKYGFEILNLKKIEIYIEHDNDVSRHLHEKVGFKYVRTDEKDRRIYEFTKEMLKG